MIIRFAWKHRRRYYFKNVVYLMASSLIFENPPFSMCLALNLCRCVIPKLFKDIVVHPVVGWCSQRQPERQNPENSGAFFAVSFAGIFFCGANNNSPVSISKIEAARSISLVGWKYSPLWENPRAEHTALFYSLFSSHFCNSNTKSANNNWVRAENRNGFYIRVKAEVHFLPSSDFTRIKNSNH